MKYTYLGDRFTDPELKGMQCDPILRNGKCIRSKKATMLVISDKTYNVLARRLRKNEPSPT